ncbi:MAG: 30S ribosomal protein S7 [Bacteroidetes bacterium MED-G17]|nr:MAG: 30S ribosomal protein S7 [Bacteroidetes bacterium TMED39]PDH51941.1 MAG: 30S ribosomal protein S7 [Bacteroidetes bacterium MED-G17]CAI8307004.1 MAG: 30S ribosomal protein S7 [Bacteroidetes bacterium MED-G17]|tara:strand:+ start:19232 stop:19705 length:474 start_codon:yes stop_codon:yes gene_type:complete
MRKSKARKRVVLPDPKFNDILVATFINNLMWDGKKQTAQRIFYDAIDIIEKKHDGEGSGLDIFKSALDNIMPSVMVKSRRVGGATFQIPMEVKSNQKIAFGMKWLIKFSRNRNDKSMAEKLSSEILAASKGEGAAVKKKEDTHKMAEANKAFSHFRV